MQIGEENIGKRTKNGKHTYQGLDEQGREKYQLVLQQGQHYEDANGSFQDCDCNIVASSTELGFDYSCEAIELPFHISSAGKRRIMLARDKSKYVDFDLPFAALGTPVVSGNKITWSKAAFSVSIVACPEGCVLEVILNQKIGNNSFSFAIKKLQGLNFLKLSQYLNRRMVATDANDKNVPLTYSKTVTAITVSLDDTGLTYPIEVK